MRVFFAMPIVVACGCAKAPPEEPPADEAPPPIGDDADPEIVADLPITSRSFDMGTAGYVPKHYPDSSDQDWQDFLSGGAAAYGGVYGVHTDPAEDVNSAGVPTQVQLAFQEMQWVEPYIAFAIDYEAGPFTEERGEALQSAAVATAENYQPKYLFLGVESNSIYLFDEGSWDLYVEVVRETYDAVKAVSPHTRVGNNFQLDRMKGQSTLTGQDVERNWDLIDDFQGKLDLVSFTAYPFLEHTTVEAIPDDYLAEIREHTDLPVVITETGWPTEDLLSGVSGSNELQIDYLKKLVDQASAIDVETLIWVFPHDAAFELAGGIFDHISLHHNDGTAKPGYAYWKAVNALPLE